MDSLLKQSLFDSATPFLIRGSHQLSPLPPLFISAVASPFYLWLTLAPTAPMNVPFKRLQPSTNANANKMGHSILGPFTKCAGGTLRLLITSFLYLIHIYRDLNLKQS